ncbi:hypothetical protein [Andreprevotia chitinilytica]|uniref:hypothetical protein n=1 Tax=Andreprevotia chitinilytica TaxID=396808 RepID=UPI0005526FB8|nr:hypothetical protein [Andreprevotia chitinilytica]
MSKTILITWRNMLPNVLSQFQERMQTKHKDNGYEELYFDDGPLKAVLHGKVPADRAERVKIYISGHGGVGIDFITDDTEKIKQTVDDLAAMLAFALRDRATSKAESAATQINMISCLFARTPDGGAHSSPAAKLHKKLADGGIYVDLVGRTESIVATKDGRTTIDLITNRVQVPKLGRNHPGLYKSKVPYTKVLHTFAGEAIQIRMAAYDGADTYVESSTLQGRRILWAEHTVNQIEAFIQLDKTGAIKEERQQVLAAVVAFYNNGRRGGAGRRDPAAFRAELASLVDGTGTTTLDNFLIHRSWYRTKWADTPKTAAFVQRLLSSYPVA